MFFNFHPFRNRKTGDYDDYGPFDEQVALEEIQEEMEYEDYGDLSKVSGPGKSIKAYILSEHISHLSPNLK